MRAPLLAAWLLAAAPAAAAPLLPSPDAPEVPDDWQPRLEAINGANRSRAAGRDPLTAPITVCLGTSCAAEAEVALADPDAAALRALFVPGPATAEDERAMIARAVALYETVVGASAGTGADRAGNARDDFDAPGQLDCISEAGNTRTYLGRLEAAGLLTHHLAAGFVTRYTLLLPHVAVELIDVDNGDAWVVDSWPTANGEEPEVAPYGQWRLEWGA